MGLGPKSMKSHYEAASKQIFPEHFITVDVSATGHRLSAPALLEIFLIFFFNFSIF